MKSPLKLFRTAVFILFSVIQLLLARSAFSEPNISSSIYNSVSRSETILSLYRERWDMLERKPFFVDGLIRLNWVDDISIKTYNRDTKSVQTTKMNLVRTYGSFTLNIPIKSKKKNQNSDPDATPEDSSKDISIAFSTMGFHYGLTRDITLGRNKGTSFYTTDYSGSQFFDDIYALTFMYKPDLILHGGVITNAEIVPHDSGTMKYSDAKSRNVRFFFDSKALSFLRIFTNTTKKQSGTTGSDITINGIVEYVSPGSLNSPLIPVFTAGYQYSREYNDKPYDSVWVGSAAGKSDTMDDSQRKSAVLHSAKLKLTEHFSENFSVEAFSSFQHIDESIYSKLTEKKIKPPPLKEFYVSADYTYYSKVSFPGCYLKFSGGLSRYWDPAILIHSSRQRDYFVWGKIYGLGIGFYALSLEFRLIDNYSNEIKKLTESTDKVSYDIALYLKF